MAKRGATSELNHDNWDEEEPVEVAGTFQKATNDVMQRRVVKIAKRRTAGLTDEGCAKNAFSSFQGFKSESVSKPKPSNDLTSTFSFLKNSCASPSPSPATNGVSSLPQSTLNFAVSSSTNNTFTSGSGTSKMDKSSDDKYPAKLIRLNQCVAEWIKSHVDKNPSCILTPIFRDYENYLKEIEEERNRSLTNKNEKKDFSSVETAISSSSISAASSSFRFNPLTSDASKTSNKTDNIIKLPSSSTVSGFSANLNNKQDQDSVQSHSIFTSFKTDSTKSGGVSSLLAKPDPASLMINPFTTSLKKPQHDNARDENKSKIPGSIFNATQDSATTSTSGFSFGSGKMLSFGNTSASQNENSGKDSNNDGDVEESGEPPKAEFTPVQESDAVYNKRCKVFIKKETNYGDLGVGTLFIKPVAGEKYQLIVRADTSLGNILVNVVLTSAIPTQRMGKNNVMVICILPSPAGSPKQSTPSTVLLRVKTSEEADELFKAIEKYKKS